MANDIKTFATSGTANVYTNAEYIADTDQANGNQPGIAKSKLVNKAIRQSSIMSNILAQYIEDKTGENIVDDGTTATILANLKAATTAEKKLWQNQAITKNLTVNTDYTLSVAENLYGKIIITDTTPVLTVSRNIIVDTSERLFIFQNNTLQALTVKTSAGAGISVQPGVIVELICNGVSVINSFNYFATLSTNFSGDLNNIKAQGNYAINSVATNLPAAGYYSLSVFGNETTLSQLATNRADGKTYVRAWDGTTWTAWVELGAGGKLLQVVNYTTGTLATGTTVIPLDNTIPQNTEGTQFMSLAITPLSAASKLKITVVANIANSLSAHITAALFRDSVANALGSCFTIVQTANFGNSLAFVVFENSVSTAATTFKVRIGPDGASTLTFNGRSAAQLLGGSFASSITIEEIEV